MPAPWRTRRRDTYSPRQHDAHARRDMVGVRTYGEAERAVPEEVTWRMRDGDELAHAFSAGPGFMRSVCRAERWSVLWREAVDGTARCFECADLVAGEITELELRAMDGDR